MKPPVRVPASPAQRRPPSLLWLIGLPTLVVVAITLADHNSLWPMIGGWSAGTLLGVWWGWHRCTARRQFSFWPTAGGALGGAIGGGLGAAVFWVQMVVANPSFMVPKGQDYESVSAGIVGLSAMIACLLFIAAGGAGGAAGGLCGLTVTLLRGLWKGMSKSPEHFTATATKDAHPAKGNQPHGRLDQAIWIVRHELDGTTQLLTAFVAILLLALVNNTWGDARDSAVLTFTVLLLVPALTAVGMALYGAHLASARSNAMGDVLRASIPVGRPLALKTSLVVTGLMLLCALIAGRAQRQFSPVMPMSWTVGAGAVWLPVFVVALRVRRLYFYQHRCHWGLLHTMAYQRFGGYSWGESSDADYQKLILHTPSGKQKRHELLIPLRFADLTDRELSVQLRETPDAGQLMRPQAILDRVAPGDQTLCVFDASGKRRLRQIELHRHQHREFIERHDDCFARYYVPSSSDEPIQVFIDLLLWGGDGEEGAGTALLYLAEPSGPLRFPIPVDWDVVTQVWNVLNSAELPNTDPTPCFLRTLDLLGATVKGIYIVDLLGMGVAHLHVEKGAQKLHAPLTVAEGIAVATIRRVPIFIQPQAIAELAKQGEPLNAQAITTAVHDWPDYRLVEAHGRDLKSPLDMTADQYKRYHSENGARLQQQLQPPRQLDMSPFGIELIFMTRTSPVQCLFLVEQIADENVADGIVPSRLYMEMSRDRMMRLWEVVSRQNDGRRLADAWLAILNKLGGALRRVSIDGLRDNLFACRLHIAIGEDISLVNIDASSGLALAWAANLPFEISSNTIVQLQSNPAGMHIQALREKAQALADEGHHHAAVAAYTEILADAPDDWKARADRALIFLQKLGDWEGAIADLTALLRLRPDLAETWYLRGVAYDNVANTKAAIADLNDAIQRQRKMAKYYYYRGSLRGVSEDLPGAIDDLTMAIRLDSGHAKAFRARGLVWRAMGEAEKSAADLARATALDAQVGDRSSAFT